MGKPLEADQCAEKKRKTSEDKIPLTQYRAFLHCRNFKNAKINNVY